MQYKFCTSIQMPLTNSCLMPNAMHKLPSGSIKPCSWLKQQLEIAFNGIPGQYWKKSPYLSSNNGWLHPERMDEQNMSNTDRAWEEQAYYLRGFAKFAALTDDPEAVALMNTYMDKMLDSRMVDGWFGPQSLKTIRSSNKDEKDTFIDLWPHMVMTEAIITWYEYTGNIQLIEMLRQFMYFCMNAPDSQILPLKKPGKDFSWLSSVQYSRACDILPSIYKVMEITGDEKLVELVHRIYMKWSLMLYEEGNLSTCDCPATEFLTTHTVNFAQMFAYRTYYSRVMHKKWLRDSAHYWYDQHMQVWGTLPRGIFCADENIRRKCTDPRYGMESCTIPEFMRSFNYLGEMNMETVWADRTEDILFNHYPAAYTENMQKLHYITCANQVMLDDYLYHDVANQAHTFAYSDTENRCCIHNAGSGWPLYIEYMMTKVSDGGVCAWLHGAYTAKLTAGKNNTPIKWVCETLYPFRDKLSFTLETKDDVDFPFYIRIPRWCKNPEVTVNGEKISVDKNVAGQFLRIDKTWKNADKVDVILPSEITVSENIRNGGITIDKGAFSYSLQIREVPNDVVSSAGDNPEKVMWDENSDYSGKKWTELLPGSRWNYGIIPEAGFVFEEKEMPHGTPFFWQTPPMVIKAKGRLITAWKLQDHMCAKLQQSPIKSDEKIEEIILIPLGCARLRISVFPVIFNGLGAREWLEVPENTPLSEREKIRS